jgi:hypothetical protein
MGVLQDENDMHNNRATNHTGQRKGAEFLPPSKAWADSKHGDYLSLPLQTVETRLHSEISERNKPISPMSRTYIDDSGNLTKTTLNYNDSESARHWPRERRMHPPLWSIHRTHEPPTCKKEMNPL